ncbi:hypothetical protein ACH4LN_25295 [Streptomyces albus]|uniref:hypothetical protein n=1 Tax=Streptomyces albus TaxID=1888 RepID=UPI0006B5C1B7|nr:hypothetical protein [Streptomyces albus]KPC65766.1 hypothetical protein ADL27_59915 [Streptomyces sp. NRRL F-6602]QID35051.1 hypothetical protein G3260_000950 [Streptomyces albus]
MTLTYHDIMQTNLSCLSDASRAWRKMGDKFGDLQGKYDGHVRGLSDGSWQGVAYEVYGKASDNTHREFGAAKTEAHAIASILDDAHAQLTEAKKTLSSYVEDLRDAGYTVNSHGRVSYEAGSEEKRSLVQSGSWQDVMDKVETANARIKKTVANINAFDMGIQAALEAAVTEKKDKGAPGGFNAEAGDVIPRPARKKGGKSDNRPGGPEGWKADGSFTLNGLDMGGSRSGVGYGMEGMAKGYMDLAHMTAEGSVSKGDVKLSGIMDVYGGARGSASYGATEQGVWGEAEVSAGSRGTVEGRMESGHFGAYARGSQFAGAEAGVNAAVGRDKTGAGMKAFAGQKQTAAIGAEAGGIGVGGKLETWEGEGVEGFVGWEKDEHGRWHFGARAGGTPIVPVGGLAGLEITVDPGKVADTVKDIAGAVSSPFRNH